MTLGFFCSFTQEGCPLLQTKRRKAIVNTGFCRSQIISWAPFPTAKIVSFWCLKGLNPMDLEEEAVENPVKGETDDQEGNTISEPYVGMEFDSEEAARKFYIDYARQVGFVVRIMQRRRSGIDGRTLARRLGCNKQGFSPNHKCSHGPEKKPRPSAREGCKATILVKMEKSGKWVVTRFEKDHNHPLVITANGFSSMSDKEKKIEELSLELERQEQLCVAYREQLLSFMNNVDQQNEELSSKIQPIVENLRRIESETQKYSIYR